MPAAQSAMMIAATIAAYFHIGGIRHTSTYPRMVG